jgi:hypothetical protein
MIVRFNLNRCLSKYKKNQLPDWAINPAGKDYADTWINFAMGLLRDHRRSRTEFSFVDRTGSVPSIVKTYFPLDQQIPTGTPRYSSYLDNCLLRAQELLDTGKQINLMWSGGLDSTVALFSLLRQAKHLDQVNILCTFESILESGSMFDKIIKHTGVRVKFDQTRLEYTLPFSYDHEDTTQLYVSGQCGDQLFGPARALTPVQAQSHDRYQQWYTEDFLSIIEPSIKFSERPIKTVRDLAWWTFFNHTWTTVLYEKCVGLPPSAGQRMHAFYATPEFQRWAVHTPDYYENRDQYRWSAKNALRQLIDYPYYIDYKQKGESVTWVDHPGWYMLDKNFITYYQDR